MGYSRILTGLLLIIAINFLCVGCDPGTGGTSSPKGTSGLNGSPNLSDVKALAARYARSQVHVPVEPDGGVRIENSFSQIINGEKIYLYDFIFRVRKPNGSWSSWQMRYRIAIARRGKYLELLQYP